MPNAWGFNESAPGGGGVRTDKVLSRQEEPKETLDHPVPSPGWRKSGGTRDEQPPVLDRLLFLKGWLEAALKDVEAAMADAEEALSKTKG